MKIIDKINANIKEGKTFFSFEFFPPSESFRQQQTSPGSQLALCYGQQRQAAIGAGS
jgi:hypothetical protein